MQNQRMEEEEEGAVKEEGRGRCGVFWGRAGLLVLVTGYALLGALLFKALEGGRDGGVPTHVQRSREDCLRELWLITERLNVLYEKNWTRLVTEQLKRFERAVVEAGKAEGAPDMPAHHWSFAGALLYTITLLTTIGYGRLSPRTALGKVTAIVYAIIGVPLMLILLSALGNMLANGLSKAYARLCCRVEEHGKKNVNANVNYHKAPSSPSAKHGCRSNHEDTASIQLSSCHSTPNHVCRNSYVDQEMPKRALLATIRASHSRGRGRPGVVRQMLADPLCPAHSLHSTPVKVKNSVVVGIADVEEADDDEEHHHCTHDTPSRVPLIWRPPEEGPQMHCPPPPPPVPATLVLLFFVGYVCAGALAFASTSGWSFLDAAYFCFIALSTIGIGDKVPQHPDYGQLQLFACCLYLFLGLVVVAMCFSLVHEELATRCRQVAANIGLMRH